VRGGVAVGGKRGPGGRVGGNDEGLLGARGGKGKGVVLLGRGEEYDFKHPAGIY